MKIIMCSKEAADKRAEASRAAVSFGLVNEQEESLSHGIVLCTQEQYEDYLMHYRRGGEKKGVRRWQNEDGSLTPEGYKHYADMYGWGKKLKKAEKLQDKADRASDKADKASRKADDDYVKAHNANQKNERRGTERSQEKADAANDRAEFSKENAEFKSVKARQAQRKASDYADKLQRKEDKMSKYVDENGDLNEKALKKYTYETGLPGERKMSLVGRLKFGNEYADKFNERHKNKMTKEETKAWEEDEKKKADKLINDEYEELKARKFEDEYDSNRLLEGSKASKEDYEKFGKHINSDMEGLNPEQQNKIVDETIKRLKDDRENRKDVYSIQDQFEADIEKGRQYEDSGLTGFVTRNFDKFTPEQKKAAGEELFNRLDSFDKHGKELGTKGYKSEDAQAIQNWLVDVVYKKSGSMNAGEYLKGSNARRAQDKVNKLFIELDSARDKTKTNAFEPFKDPRFIKAEDDVLGAILKDIGVSDTPKNRQLLGWYGWYD